MMGEYDRQTVYDAIGVPPVINATGGQLTVLGGQILSPRVLAAMERANEQFVDMKVLLEQSGKIVAELIGAEAAYVTAGCCAAMALSAAACMAGQDPEKAARLPDATGMPHEIIILGTQRYKYERCVTVPGASLIQVGDESGVQASQVEEAIGEQTAAILFVASRARENVVSLEEVLDIAKRHEVPVIVDAAGQVYPPERIKQFPAMGVDLTAHSGKYFGAPNSSGFVCGRRELVEAAAYHSFVSFEYGPPYTIGRPMKLDRQEIVAIVEALREWLTMDHEARFAGYRQRAEDLQGRLDGIPGIEATLGDAPVTRVHLQLADTITKTPGEIAQELRDGNPSIWVASNIEAYLRGQQPDTLSLSVTGLVSGDVERIERRLREILAG
jgi:D-glucosaminate-6-phosphate ammonia-lyase